MDDIQNYPPDPEYPPEVDDPPELDEPPEPDCPAWLDHPPELDALLNGEWVGGTQNFIDDRQNAWHQTAAALTLATHERVELDGFLATALAVAAANAGSRHLLTTHDQTAGGVIQHLLDRVLGDREVDLSWRTTPVTVPLNVPSLSWQVHQPEPDPKRGEGDHDVVPWPDPLWALGRRWVTATIRCWGYPGDIPVYARRTWRNSGPHDLGRVRRRKYEYACNRVDMQFIKECKEYARKFTYAIHRAIRETPGLLDTTGQPRVPIRVVTVVDPRQHHRLRNPTELESDLLIWHLWSRALDHAGPPPVRRPVDTDKPRGIWLRWQAAETMLHDTLETHLTDLCSWLAKRSRRHDCTCDLGRDC